MSSCQHYGVSLTGSFCTRPENIYIGGNEKWDKNIVRYLAEKFASTDVLELGAGLGHYAKYIQNTTHGFAPVTSYRAFDGMPWAPEVTDGFVQHFDLLIPHAASQWITPADWVLCLEVAEHISMRHERKILDHLFLRAKGGVVMSWAHNDQAGFQHINLRSSNYVIKTVQENFPFRLDLKMTMDMRTMAILPWFRQNILVFRRVGGGVAVDAE